MISLVVLTKVYTYKHFAAGCAVYEGYHLDAHGTLINILSSGGPIVRVLR